MLTMVRLVALFPYPLPAVHLYNPALILLTLTSRRKLPLPIDSIAEKPSLVQVMLGVGSPDA